MWTFLTFSHTPWIHTQSSSGQPYCCGARGVVGGSVPCSSVSPQSWYWRWKVEEIASYSLPPPTIPAGPETRTRDLRVTSLTLYPLGHDCPTTAPRGPLWADLGNSSPLWAWRGDRIDRGLRRRREDRGQVSTYIHKLSFEVQQPQIHIPLTLSHGAGDGAPLHALAAHGFLPRGGLCSRLLHLVSRYLQHWLRGDPQVCRCGLGLSVIGGLRLGLRTAGRLWAGLWVWLCSGSGIDALHREMAICPNPEQNSTAYSKRGRSLQAREMNKAAMGPIWKTRETNPGEKEICLNCAFSDTLTIFKLYYIKCILNVLFWNNFKYIKYISRYV